MLCCGVSAESIRIISRGLNTAICRTISEPMLPADPVINTVLPLNIFPMASISTLISLRGSRSSILISLKLFTVMLLSTFHSCRSGIIRICTSLSISSSCSSVSLRNFSRCKGETITALMPFSAIISVMFLSGAYTCLPIRV